MNEKRVLIAALISSIFLAWYAQTMTRVQPQRAADSSGTPPIQAIDEQKAPGRHEAAETTQLLADEDVISLGSSEISVEIGQTSGAIRRVVLKKFSAAPGGNALELRGEHPTFRFSASPSQLSWHVVQQTSTTAVLDSSKDADGRTYTLSYTLDSNSPLVHYVLKENYSNASSPNVIPGATIVASWKQADSLGKQSNHLEAVLLQESGEKKSYKRHMAISKGEKIVPRGTTILSLAERYFCQSIRFSSGQAQVKILPSSTGEILVTAFLEPAAAGTAHTGEIYLGPRDYFYLKRSGFEAAFPIGMLGQIGLVLLLALGWVASVTKNYGIAIIVFSGLITCLTAPFTILSFRSMKKMQELKPHIDKLMAKHKDDPKKANAEVFALYKTHKVSPISGCLPMLLQMPIVIAMFQAITHDIGLRGKSFLWIADLSLPDRLWQLPMALPLLGRDLNLLPVLMAGAMFIQTKFSQQNMGSTEANPMAKMMSGPMMSVMFGIMFYQFPSGLVLYWLTNSLMSMVWYRVAK